MEKIKPFVFLMTVFFVLFLAAACTGGPPPGDEDKLELEPKKITVSVLLFPEQISGSPRMNFTLSVLKASGSEELENFFNVLLYDGRTIDEYKETLIECYRSAYQNMREVAEQRPDIPPSAMDWEYTEIMETRTFSDRGLLIERKKEYYTGGAHGMEQKIYYTVDLKEPKVLRMEDLFTDPESPELRRIVWNGLREYAALEENIPLSSGIYFDDEPEMSGNCFPTYDGLGLRWNPYEIGPYSEGAIEIILPWKKIRHLLSKEGAAIPSQWFRIPL
jgi:hypothetical protein